MNRNEEREYFLKKNRPKTAERFFIHQVARFRSLYPIDGVFKDDLQDVFLIELIDKENTKKRHSHYLGSRAGPDLIQLAEPRQHPIPKFDPLREFTKESHTSRGFNEVVKNKDNSGRRTSINEEAFNAVNLFIVAKRLVPKPGHILAKILDQLYQHPDEDISPKLIKGFNTVLRHWHPPMTMQEIISQMRNDYPSLKEFSFPVMTEKLGLENFLGDSPPNNGQPNIRFNI